MKLFQSVVLFPLIWCSIAGLIHSVPVESTTTAIATTSPKPSLLQQTASFINEKIIYKAIGLFEGKIHTILRKQLTEIEAETLGSAPELLDLQWEKALAEPFFHGHVSFLQKHILEPLRRRQQAFHEQIKNDLSEFMTGFNDEAEKAMFSLIMEALRGYFALGEENATYHHSDQPSPTLLSSGLFGWLQGKLEDLHATIMHQTVPGLISLLDIYEEKVDVFLQEHIQLALYSLFTSDITKHRHGKRFLDWIAKKLHAKLSIKVQFICREVKRVTVQTMGKTLREELYAPFSTFISLPPSSTTPSTTPSKDKK